MRDPRDEVVAPNLTEVLGNLDDDLDRIELWTAALNCFLRPAPKYQPDKVASGEREGTIRSMIEARDRTTDVAHQVKSAAEDLHGQTGRRASQVADAAGSMKVARNAASSLGDAVRNSIKNQPYPAVAIAWGLGWLLGGMPRLPLVWVQGRDVRPEADREVSTAFPRLRRQDYLDVCARSSRARDPRPSRGALRQSTCQQI